MGIENPNNPQELTEAVLRTAILDLLHDDQKVLKKTEVERVAESLMALAKEKKIKDSLNSIVRVSKLVDGYIPLRPIRLYRQRSRLRRTFYDQLGEYVKKPDHITVEGILSLVPHAEELIASWNTREK